MVAVRISIGIAEFSCCSVRVAYDVSQVSNWGIETPDTNMSLRHYML